jgi:hypothetical protein
MILCGLPKYIFINFVSQWCDIYLLNLLDSSITSTDGRNLYLMFLETFCVLDCPHRQLKPEHADRKVKLIHSKFYCTSLQWITFRKIKLKTLFLNSQYFINDVARFNNDKSKLVTLYLVGMSKNSKLLHIELSAFINQCHNLLNLIIEDSSWVASEKFLCSVSVKILHQLQTFELYDIGSLGPKSLYFIQNQCTSLERFVFDGSAPLNLSFTTDSWIYRFLHSLHHLKQFYVTICDCFHQSFVFAFPLDCKLQSMSIYFSNEHIRNLFQMRDLSTLVKRLSHMETLNVVSTKCEPLKQHLIQNSAIVYTNNYSGKLITIDSESWFCRSYNSKSFIEFFAVERNFTHIELKKPRHEGHEEALIRTVSSSNPNLKTLDIPTCSVNRCKCTSCNQRSNKILKVYQEMLMSNNRLENLTMRLCCDEFLLCEMFRCVCHRNEIQYLTIWNNNITSDGVWDILNSCRCVKQIKIIHHHNHTIDGKYRINSKLLADMLLQQQCRTVVIFVEVL